MLKEDALSLAVPRQRRRRRRKIEIEAERAAKRRNLMEMVAQLRESHAAIESQTQAMDLTKVFALVSAGQKVLFFYDRIELSIFCVTLKASRSWCSALSPQQLYLKYYFIYGIYLFLSNGVLKYELWHINSLLIYYLDDFN